jgi:hypothetical protein
MTPNNHVTNQKPFAPEATMPKPTRTDAKRYLGMRTEQGVRYQERLGNLHPTKDENGINRFEPAELDRLKKRREEKGITPRLTTEELARTRADRADEMAAMRECDASFARVQTEADTHRRLRAEVERTDEAAREEFLRDHVDEPTAGEALGFTLLERRVRLEKLGRAGVLHPVEPPLRARIIRGDYGESLRVERGPHRLALAGPFYSRAEVLSVRNQPPKPPPPSPTFEELLKKLLNRGK